MTDTKGVNDPRFEDAKKLLEQEGLVLSVNNLKKLLGIGDVRAKAILEALEPFIVHTPADDSLLGGDDSELPKSEGNSGVPTSNVGTSGDSSEPKNDGEADGKSGTSEVQDGTAPVTSGSPSQEPTVPAKDTSDAVTAPSVDSRAGSGPVKERKVIGQHPVTEQPVYEDEI